MAHFHVGFVHGQPNISGQHRHGESATGGGWSWDGARLHVRAGAGDAPLIYLHRWPGGATVSTSLASIISHDHPALDSLAWTTYLCLGYFVGEDTPYRGVTALWPGRRITVDSRGMTRLAVTPEYDSERVSESAALDRFSCLLNHSTERLAALSEDRGVTVELSAGIDSRQVLASLLQTGTRVERCVTSTKYPPDDVDERAIARAVADAAGTSWRHAAPPEDRATAEAIAAVRQGFASDEGAWFQFRCHSDLADARTWFSGLGGDTLTGRRLGNVGETDEPMRKGDLRGVAQCLVNQTRRRNLLPALVEAYGVPTVRVSAVVDHIAEELSRHTRAADPVAAFTFWNRVRRKHLPGVTGLLPRGVAARLSFFDDDLVRFLLSVGPRVRFGSSFQARAVQRTRLSAVPLDTRGKPAAVRLRPVAHVLRYFIRLKALVRRLDPDASLPPWEALWRAGSPRMASVLLTNSLHLIMMAKLAGPSGGAAGHD